MSGPGAAAAGPGAAWADYQAAAQRLDEARRAAATEACRHAEVAEAARQELAVVRARLAAAHAQLRDLGAPAADVLPRNGDHAHVRPVAGGPDGVLVALRQAGSMLEDSAAALAGREPRRRARLSRVGRRNLFGYAPVAVAALAGQIALYVIAAAGPHATSALVAGLVLPVAAFGLGWLTLGLAFPPGPAGRVERTPLLGAVVCAVPAILTYLVAVVLVSAT